MTGNGAFTPLRVTALVDALVKEGHIAAAVMDFGSWWGANDNVAPVP
jgi:hypothetical protein